MSESRSQQQLAAELVEETIHALQNLSDAQSIHEIKKLQDTVKRQHEQHRFEAKELIKARVAELKVLEEQAKEPHREEFEEERERLEEENAMLKSELDGLKIDIESKKKGRIRTKAELSELNTKEDSLKRQEDELNLSIQYQTHFFQCVTSIHWELEAESIKGIIFATQRTKEFDLSPQSCPNGVANELWKLVDETVGMSW